MFLLIYFHKAILQTLSADFLFKSGQVQNTINCIFINPVTGWQQLPVSQYEKRKKNSLRYSEGELRHVHH